MRSSLLAEHQADGSSRKPRPSRLLNLPLFRVLAWTYKVEQAFLESQQPSPYLFGSRPFVAPYTRCTVIRAISESCLRLGSLPKSHEEPARSMLDAVGSSFRVPCQTSPGMSVLYQHPQLPFKRPQIPSYRDHKALNRGTLGSQGTSQLFGCDCRHS